MTNYAFPFPGKVTFATLDLHLNLFLSKFLHSIFKVEQESNKVTGIDLQIAPARTQKSSGLSILVYQFKCYTNNRVHLYHIS